MKPAALVRPGITLKGAAMNTKLLRGYFLLAAVMLILAGALVLLLTNMDNDWRLKVYWRDRIMPRAAWLVLAGIGGLVVWWTLRKMLPAASMRNLWCYAGGNRRSK